MTRFKETASRTIKKATKIRSGWLVRFIDGSCQLINKDQKRGTLPFKSGVQVVSCRTRCNGADENGKCTLRPLGRPTDNVPNIDCHEQFVYAYKPKNFGKKTPKFDRCTQKMSYQIKSFRTIKPRLFTEPEQWRVTFADQTTKTFLKSAQLGRMGLKHNYYLVPCGEECIHRGGACIHCYGKRRGTECNQQFYFCRKFLARHKFDKKK